MLDPVRRGWSLPKELVGGCCRGGRGFPPRAGRWAPNSVPSPWQGLDRAGRPLIIGPEEDCDPGYFNNEVTASEVFLAFAPSP